jgi:hypothetical protein
MKKTGGFWMPCNKSICTNKSKRFAEQLAQSIGAHVQRPGIKKIFQYHIFLKNNYSILQKHEGTSTQAWYTERANTVPSVISINESGTIDGCSSNLPQKQNSSKVRA